MEKNRIRIYWLLLAAVLCTGLFAQAVGITRARYQDTVTAVAVMNTQTADIISNCLVTASDAPRTVLLGEADMENVTEVPFWLQSSGTSGTVRLTWGTSDPDYEGYFHMALLYGAEGLEAGEEIPLQENDRLELKLRLEPLWDSGTAIPEETGIEKIGNADKIDVFVEAYIDTRTAAEVSAGDAAENTTDGTTESAGGITMKGIFRVSLPAVETVWGNDALPTELSVSDNDALAAYSGVSDNDADSADSGDGEAQIGLKTLNAFDIYGQLPVAISLTEDITGVRLGCGNAAWPDYTMLSMDGGESYYMLYGDYRPEFERQGENDMSLLLDFRYAEQEAGVELSVVMEAYAGNELRKTCTAVTRTVTAQEEEGEDVPSPVVDFEHMLEFDFLPEWKEAELQYDVEHLTMSQEQKPEYIPVELSEDGSEDGLQITYYNDENNHRLELKPGRKFTKPGTYRIRLTWIYEGLCYDTEQTTFFVNCSGREEAMASGLEVSDDE